MRTSSFVVVGALAMLVAAVGCSSGGDSSDPGQGGDEQDIKSAQQCKGFLPQTCEVCADGTTQCAHWTKKDGKCAIEVCPAADTACTGMLPKTCEVCADGTTQCAHWTKKDGKCSVEICPPECAQASDCHGALPQIAEVCSDGQTHSAHFACNAGKCEVEVCPK